MNDVNVKLMKSLAISLVFIHVGNTHVVICERVQGFSVKGGAPKLHAVVTFSPTEKGLFKVVRFDVEVQFRFFSQILYLVVFSPLVQSNFNLFSFTFLHFCNQIIH